MNQTISTSGKNGKRELPVLAAGVVLAAFLLLILFANWVPTVVEEPPVVQNEGVVTEIHSEQFPVWEPYEERYAPEQAGETAVQEYPVWQPYEERHAPE